MPRPTIETATRAFLRDKKTLRQKSQEFYLMHLNAFTDWGIAHNPQIKNLEEIKASTLIEYQNYLVRKGRSENTVHGAIRTVKTFMKWASLDDEFEDDVSQRELMKIKIPRVHEKDIQRFSDAEIEKMLRTIEADTNPVHAARDKAIMLLLLDTGARVSEVALDGERLQEPTGIHIKDLLIQDSKDLRIKIMGKGGKIREVPIGHSTSKALRIYIGRYREETKDHDYLFLSRGKNPLSVRGLEQVLYELSKQSGVPDVHPHKFRHTFAVKYLLKTKDIYGLSRLLGHTSIKITERYLRSLNLEDIRKRGSIVDDIL